MKKQNRNRKASGDRLEARIAQLQPQPTKSESAAARDPNLPLWLPDACDLERMPVEVRQAVAEIVQPAYAEMVQGAATGMEKSLGASIVHLLWLEILDQYDIKKDYTNNVLTLGMESNRKDAIAQYIRLIDAKLRVGNFMVRLRELLLREKRISPLPLAGTTEWSGPGVRAAGFNSPKIPLENSAAKQDRANPQNYTAPEDFPVLMSYPLTETEFAAQRKLKEEAAAWKNEPSAPKNDAREIPREGSNPKPQESPKCKNQDLPTKNPAPETSSPPEGSKCKNQDLMTKNPAPENEFQALLNFTNPTPTWKNEQSAPKIPAPDASLPGG
jgi:hypothetical protein